MGYYDCRIQAVSGTPHPFEWMGVVRLYKTNPCYHDAGYDILFCSHPLPTQSDAGEAAINWCSENKITKYTGPIMSGQGSPLHIVFPNQYLRL